MKISLKIIEGTTFILKEFLNKNNLLLMIFLSLKKVYMKITKRFPRQVLEEYSLFVAWHLVETINKNQGNMIFKDKLEVQKNSLQLEGEW